MKTLVWIRNDLRFSDNPALYHACKESDHVIALFIWSPEDEGNWASGSASRWWLHHSLTGFAKKCHAAKLPFVIKNGPAKEALHDLINETKADKIVWNRRYESAGMKLDAQVRSSIKIESETFPGNLLFEPQEITTKAGKPFKVFTPYWKACLEKGNAPSPLRKPTIPRSTKRYKSLSVDDLKLLPKIHWDAKFYDIWEPGEDSAKTQFKKFLKSGIADYKTLRDFPAIEGTSRMSPHLHFGEISPRWIWDQVYQHNCGREEGVRCYLSEIGWREFAYHLLFHFPKTPTDPLYPKFKKLKWKKSPKNLKAWQQGMTGYPIVDAGMRQLWHTGWMHNRLRMIVGSFLVKDLLISWTEGARWFWDTLVDADLASNSLGWQWVGGCGADAAPFFRVFNPITQGEKFDPEGEFIKQWIPELKEVPQKWIHKPWESGLDLDYPAPIVEHAEARKRALAAFDKIKR